MVNSRFLFMGLALALPFAIANALVVMQSRLFLLLLRPSGQTTGYEQVFVLILIALVGIGGFVVLFPIVKERRVYLLNATIGATLIMFALFAGYGLGLDVYHCDVLKIPNCD